MHTGMIIRALRRGVFPYSQHRRKVILISAFLILSFFFSISCVVKEKTETDIFEWTSTAGSRGTWPSFFPLLKKDSDIIIEQLLKLDAFEKYVLTNDSLDPDRMKDIHENLFPYLNYDDILSGNPSYRQVFTRWNGEIFSNSIPTFSIHDNSFVNVAPINYNKSLSFWANWQQQMMQPGSKGIVISVGGSQVAQTIRQIRVLRLLKNTMPIQIVHKGDLAQSHIDYLIKVAREPMTEDFPSQELWILDVSKLLNPRFATKFKRYSNKWLALLFCSFESPILLDADTVPFKSLDTYYSFQQFQTMGSVFFKDRKLTSDKLNRGQTRTLRRIVRRLLAPSRRFSLTSDLYAQVQDPIVVEVLKNMLEHRYKHHMESGLVLINKKLHMMSLLTSVGLQFSSICEYFHGDKEWFWFAQLLRKVPFTFHPVDASNVGKLEEITINKYQICSVQLSHTDVDGTLLWINGGLNNCKVNSWDFDYRGKKKISSAFRTVDELKDFYLSPVVLENAIIPDTDKKPWLNTEGCARYSYCAFFEKNKSGKLISFSEVEKEYYRQIVEIWNLPLQLGVELRGSIQGIKKTFTV